MLNNKNRAFTIVELLVTIVVIAVLAVIAIVSYSGISTKAMEASIKSDLSQASKKFKLYQLDHGVFPSSLDVNGCPVSTTTTPGTDTRYCIKGSDGNAFEYHPESATNPKDYTLVSSKGSVIFHITPNSSPEVGGMATVPLSPSNPAIAAVLSNRINISWQAPSSDGGSAVTGYQIYKGTVSGSETLIASLGNTLSYTDSAITASTTYYYKVSAVNAIGEGAFSSTINATSLLAGFIKVPGSSTYSTSDFIVMKYEAKNASGVIPVSQAAGLPWVDSPQEVAGANNDFKEYSQNVVGCSGCHMITEAEWLTISQNVLGVSSNWSGGAVGSGYIYSGHNDSVPNNALVADANDANGYSGTGQSSGSQRRTLALSNGEVIWDFAGNVQEWTSAQITTGKPGITGSGYGWREYTAMTNQGSMSPGIFPAVTGIAGASSWNSTNGIGIVYSSADDSSIRGALRGGSWTYGTYAGVLCLAFDANPPSTGPNIGFRVAK